MSEPTTNESETSSAAAGGRLPWKWLLSGLVLGALLILGIRFATYHDPAHDTHYHANFALYINGERELFKDAKYYEEVQICSQHGASPKARVHMHNEQNGAIHVHDAAVTWNDFLMNLGWTIGPDFIANGSILYRADDRNKLNIMLNGQDLTGVTNIANEVIGNKDRLLISYGPDDNETLQAQYKTVPSTAAKLNTQQDPAACGGAETPSAGERLRHLL